MPRDFFPHRDLDLLEWILAFDRVLAVDPAAYGVPADEAARLAVAIGRFETDYATATKPRTRTSIAIMDKDVARGDMIRQLRTVVRYVQARPGMTDAMRLSLGLPVRDADARTRDSVLSAPDIFIDGVDGISVSVRAVDTALRRRGRPSGARGVAWFTAVGDTMPATSDGWVFRQNTQGVSATIDFPDHLPPGGSVWIVAAWLDGKSQLSAFSTPVQSHVMRALPRLSA